MHWIRIDTITTAPDEIPMPISSAYVHHCETARVKLSARCRHDARAGLNEIPTTAASARDICSNNCRTSRPLTFSRRQAGYPTYLLRSNPMNCPRRCVMEKCTYACSGSIHARGDKKLEVHSPNQRQTGKKKQAAHSYGPIHADLQTPASRLPDPSDHFRRSELASSEVKKLQSHRMISACGSSHQTTHGYLSVSPDG